MVEKAYPWLLRSEENIKLVVRVNFISFNILLKQSINWYNL